MRNIAIIKIGYNSGYSDEDIYRDNRFLETITDWTEVSDEDYNILLKEQFSGGFVVIEKIPEQEKFIQETVKGYLDRIKKRKADAEKAAKRYEERRQAAKEKRERKAFEKLKAKFEKEDK